MGSNKILNSPFDIMLLSRVIAIVIAIVVAFHIAFHIAFHLLRYVSYAVL